MEGNSGGGNDVELMCKTLQVEHPRGWYLNISEKTSATRSTIIVSFSGIASVLDIFNYYVNSNDQEAYSKELQLDTKIFHFDVGENRRGRFLKSLEPEERIVGLLDDVGAGFISGHNSQASQVFDLNIDRSVDLPPQEDINSMGISKVIRAYQKKFLFDLGSNNQGHFLRIFEVSGSCIINYAESRFWVRDAASVRVFAVYVRFVIGRDLLVECLMKMRHL